MRRRRNPGRKTENLRIEARGWRAPRMVRHPICSGPGIILYEYVRYPQQAVIDPARSTPEPGRARH